MTPSARARLARKANWAGAAILLGLLWVALMVWGLSAFLPSTPAAELVRPTAEALTAEDELGLNEGAWLTDDCTPAADWPEDEIPASAVVRHTDSRQLERLPFDDAWAFAETGVAWTVLLCEEEAR